MTSIIFIKSDMGQEVKDNEEYSKNDFFSCVADTSEGDSPGIKS